ncbi:uncharacterized protein LOC126801889 [Argentina anserina]|uniref:uncharacterized protein LOC126801889 n=1 Tax=Argentina anserina TaxID=57926 RepID=UPI00217661F5|nr:uncharacterized protein LOC126801889 [Potentilla anserina]
MFGFFFYPIQDNTMLLKPVEDLEIWEAVKSIGGLKAPGPDGLHASFFHDCWEEVNDTVIPMIKDIFQDSKARRSCCGGISTDPTCWDKFPQYPQQTTLHEDYSVVGKRAWYPDIHAPASLGVSSFAHHSSKIDGKTSSLELHEASIIFRDCIGLINVDLNKIAHVQNVVQVRRILGCPRPAANHLKAVCCFCLLRWNHCRFISDFSCTSSKYLCRYI